MSNLDEWKRSLNDLHEHEIIISEFDSFIRGAVESMYTEEIRDAYGVAEICKGNDDKWFVVLRRKFSFEKDGQPAAQPKPNNHKESE